MTPQFSAAVKTYGPRFMADLGLDKLEVSGMFGNFAVESDQFRALQEYKPTVAGSRGGWGWPQWTGPRRRAFEAWAAAKNYKLDSPEAFYQYILVELRGSEATALARLRATTTLDRATEVFMLAYERPGVPHLDTRKARALEALHVLEDALAERAAVNRDLGLPPPVIPTKPTTEEGASIFPRFDVNAPLPKGTAAPASPIPVLPPPTPVAKPTLGARMSGWLTQIWSG